MQLPNELNSKRQDPEDEYKTKMYQSSFSYHFLEAQFVLCHQDSWSYKAVNQLLS